MKQSLRIPPLTISICFETLPSPLVAVQTYVPKSIVTAFVMVYRPFRIRKLRLSRDRLPRRGTVVCFLSEMLGEGLPDALQGMFIVSPTAI